MGLFSGRLGIRNYTVGMLINLALDVAYTYMIFLFGNISQNQWIDVIWIVSLGSLLIVFSMSLLIRRAHDIGKSGRWVLTEGIYSLKNILWMYSLGDYGPNEYGDKPQDNISFLHIVGFR